MLAFHAIISAYGFWLPNDPRGSWSDFVGSWELFRYGGDATKRSTKHSLARRPHNTRQRQATKSYLKHPAVSFTGQQAKSIAAGFRTVADETGYRILALAMLPEHTHLVIGHSSRDPSHVIGHLKRGATDHLIDDGLHPCFVNQRITHSCWAKQAWKVFIDTEDQLGRAIKYVQDNPVKEGKPRQHWSFIDRYRDLYFADHSARQAGRLTKSVTSMTC